MVKPAAIKRARKASQRIWRDIAAHTLEMPVKSIVAPFTDQQTATLQRLSMVITRLSEPDPSELHRVLSHADIVVGASGAKVILGATEHVEELCFAGGELISDDEVEDEAVGGWYATTMRHLDWLRDSSPDIEERHIAENMRVRFFMSVGNAHKFIAWVRTVQDVANEFKSELWVNVANAATELLSRMGEAGKRDVRERESPILQPR